ncbi:hypothetical protein [Paludibacter sp. 221]|uniref:hypothetical protein n=1 Tax=Paludibacter sp. 221 TaxID=2302939 RepID=UPI0013D1D703|nr:hypothetical protein [Paludibacter sp. 221]
MTNNYDEIIQRFEKNLKDLISKCESLKEENASLKKDLEFTEKKLSRINGDFEELQNNYNHLRVARYLNVSSKERKISKQHIDKLVREIDKCLALLNE